VLAARVLFQVFEEGAFTAAALDAELENSLLPDERDRALATELCYGVVRTRPVLERRLLALAPRGIAGGDPQVLIVLLIAAYQLLCLDRIPPFAAVNEAVENLSRLRGAGVAGFANAVLRQLQKGPKLEVGPAILESVPSWLREQMSLAVGAEATQSLVGVSEARRETTPVCALFKRQAALPDWVSQGEPGSLCPRLFRFSRAGDLRRHPEYAAGDFTVQEEGAAFAGLALGARPGERVLDVCAGRGQKAQLIADQLGEAGELWVSDLSPKKLKVLESEFRRMKLRAPRAYTHDWRTPAVDINADFQRILVDAPCSGSGTLRRRPEIALRLTLDDVERQAQLAESILRQAAPHLAVGGQLVFVVCSVLSRECEDVVQRVADVLTPTPFDAPLVLEHIGSVSQFRLLPSTHGTDGFFVASLGRPA
jgi:16S rRNA (cytosine967-C5)-methyltransferase